MISAPVQLRASRRRRGVGGLNAAGGRAADVERHRAWFGKWRAHIAGGEELDLPRTVKTLRPGRQGEGISVTDGPYVETKELLGGFVIIDAADMDEAIAIASERPSLATQPKATVQLQPIYPRD